MAKTVQHKRGTTAQTNAYVGPAGEITVDTDKDLPVVHDGSQTGGFAVAARANVDGTISLIKRDGTVLAVISQADGTLDQSTETVRGTAEIATDAEMLNSANDLVIATPKKLRLGFAINTGVKGYISFPTWLGGLVIQWDTISVAANNANQSFTWPIPFPAAVRSANLSVLDASGSTGVSQNTDLRSVTNTGYVITNSSGTFASAYVIGIGF